MTARQCYQSVAEVGLVLADGAVIAVTRQSTALTSHSTVTGRTPPPTPTAVKREATGNRLDTQPALTGVQALSHTGRKFSKTTGRGIGLSLRLILSASKPTAFDTRQPVLIDTTTAAAAAVTGVLSTLAVQQQQRRRRQMGRQFHYVPIPCQC